MLIIYSSSVTTLFLSGSSAYPGNTWHKAGIHLGWNDSWSQEHTHTYTHLASYNQRKSTKTWREHAKLHTESSPSSELKWGLWSSTLMVGMMMIIIKTHTVVIYVVLHTSEFWPSDLIGWNEFLYLITVHFMFSYISSEQNSCCFKLF